MELEIPMADDKSVNPTTFMVFLGLELNTTGMSIRKPNHKNVEPATVIRTF